MPLLDWLLRLLPPALRRDYTDAIAETLERRLVEARNRGFSRYLRMVFREAGGVLWVVVAGRYRQKPTGNRYQRDDADARKAGQMDVMAQEIRHAARRLWRAPAFTAAAVSTLALAIAANVAIFAVVERVVLNPLPFPDSDRVLRLEHHRPIEGAARSGGCVGSHVSAARRPVFRQLDFQGRRQR